ncbi:MAG: hypothetical protein B7Y39_17530 [Bdellovibrio sp. 28-41-41]|nr:MAG: hypothetical protein B7Y39_17530 [Bdellovibrio sp. 28-41-41]
MTSVEGFQQKLSMALGSEDRDHFAENLVLAENKAKILQLEKKYQTAIVENRIFNFDLVFSSDSYASYEIIFKNCTFKDIKINPGTSKITFFGCTIHTLTKNNFSLGLFIQGNSRITNLIFEMSDRNLMIEIKDSVVETLFVSTGKNNQFFDNINILNSTLSKTTWEIDNTHRTKYGRLHFIGVTFHEAPNFVNTEFSKDVVFRNCIFVDHSESAQIPYRDLKHKFGENHDDLMASHFGGLELISKHNSISSRLEKVLSSVYKVLNNYGLDPYRPLLWLVKLLCLAFLVWSLSIYSLGPMVPETNGQVVSSIEQVFYMTVMSVLGPLKALGIFNILKIQTLFYQIIIFIFNLVSSLLWFFLLLAIRKRFRVSV